jgi:hypothetical protein
MLAMTPAGCGADRDTVGPEVPVPDAPVGTDVPRDDPALDGEPRPIRVAVVPGAVDLRRQPFDAAEPVGDRQLAVRFWGGVAPCSVVGRVDVAETAERIIVTLFVGRDPVPGQVACIEIAQYQEVLVDLGAPVGGRAIADGAR